MAKLTSVSDRESQTCPVSLPNLLVNVDLIQFFNKLQGEEEHEDKQSWYNYMTFSQLAKDILSCNIVTECGIPTELVDIICNFVGIVAWSKDLKFNKISIYPSTDSKILYALLNETNNRINNKVHTILLNQWIGTKMHYSNNKLVFKYIFKYFASNYGFSRLYVGFVTKEWIKQDNVGNCVIGENDQLQSVAWLCTTSNVCRFQNSNKKTKYFKSKLMTDGNINTYFMIEIDLIDKQFKIISSSFGLNNSQCHIYPIPSDILCKAPFCVGFSVQTESVNNIGLGLVNP